MPSRGTRQTEVMLANIRSFYLLKYAVQQNGLGGERTACSGPGGTGGCPNEWVYNAGNTNFTGLTYPPVTGFQTSNLKQVQTPAELQEIFENLYNNSNATFLEIYEMVHWRASGTNGGVLVSGSPPRGRTIYAWQSFLDSRSYYEWTYNLNALPDPTPMLHSFTFTRNATPATQKYYYMMSNAKCLANNTAFGSLTVVP